MSIRKRNNKYQARAKITLDGQTVEKAKTFTKRIDALKWLEETEIALRRDISTDLDEDRTLAEAMIRYREEVSPTKKGVKKETTQIAKFLRQKEFPSQVKLVNLTTEHFYKWRLSRNVQNSTKNREVALIRSILETARREWGWIRTNPIRDLRILKAAPARNRRISQQEIDLICAALKYPQGLEIVTTQQQKVAVLFLLGIETGMRLGELTSLDWSQVDLNKGTAMLLETKNGDKRGVPLSEVAVNLFKSLREKHSGEIFDIASSTVTTFFRRAVKKSNINDLTFHDTRHEACTRLSRCFDVLSLAKVIGHRDTRSLMIYYNPTIEELAMQLRSK